ncbi:MAG: hypothetical protein AAF468_11080 [Pseudomonadota bacterium]
MSSAAAIKQPAPQYAATAPIADDQVLSSEDRYLVEMTHRIAKLREVLAAMEEPATPRRWIETLNLDTLR